MEFQNENLVATLTFLLVERFKMETPEAIRASLILGEWVLSIDLSDTYLHIPIHPNSRKYIRFCHDSQVFQFTSLPFSLAMAPQVFYNDCKGSEAEGESDFTIPGRLADQGPVPEGGTSEHSDRSRPDTVLKVDIQSKEVRTQTHSGFFRLWATNTT